jgi:preprotein translocase subunit SecD
MYLGLDLRGGVHFMLQVDMRTALTKNLDTQAATCARAARQEHPPRRHLARRPGHRGRAAGPGRAGRRRRLMQDQFPDLQVDPAATAPTAGWCQLKPEALRRCRTTRSSRTSPRCTTASTNWAWPSR